MATITSALCNSYKQEVLRGEHDAADTYKFVLIKSNGTGTYNASTTNAGTPGTGSPTTSNVGTDEVATSGSYTAGGTTLTGYSVTLQGSTAVLDFTSPTAFTAATISADGLLIYNSSKTNKAVATYLFPGSPIVSTSGTFTITMPAVGSGTSLIRIQ
jgi:hypothetical protein